MDDVTKPKLLLDPYLSWAEREVVPITEDFGVDLLKVPTERWPRMGEEGGIVHLKGRGDFVSVFVLDLAPSAKSEPQKHLYEEVVYVLTGHGYSLLWYDGEKDLVRVDWQHGVVFAPPDQMFHQHFNTSTNPARYLAVAMGSLRYPFTNDKRRVFMGMDGSVKDGGCQIEYENQDARIHKIFLSELAQHGVKSGMAKFVDEAA